MACFYEMHTNWVSKGLTIKDFGYLLEDISTTASSNPEKLIDKFYKDVGESRSNNIFKGKDTDRTVFTDMEEKKLSTIV